MKLTNENDPTLISLQAAPSMQTAQKTHAYHTPENAASPPGGSTLAFIYVNLMVPGLSWQILNLAVPDSLIRQVCLYQTKSGNAILAFRSAHDRRYYQRLASYGQTEVMVMMDDTTLWGNQLSERLITNGLKLFELPVLSNGHESQLLKLLTILAESSGLHVAPQDDATGKASATQSTSSVITPHSDRS